MKQSNKKEEQVINIQLITLFVSLATAIVSIFLTYNQQLELKNKKTLFTPKKTLIITKTNRVLISIVALAFLYVNYELYQISKKEGEDLKSYTLQILASILIVISSLITLYVVFLSDRETVSDIENPIA